MPKMLFYHENFTLGGDTDYLIALLSRIPQDEFMLIYGGSSSVEKHISNSGLRTSSLRRFKSYSYSFFIHAVRKRLYIPRPIRVGLYAPIIIIKPVLDLILRIRLRKLLQSLDMEGFSRIIINSGGFYGTDCSRLILRYVNGKCTYIIHNHIPLGVTKNQKRFDAIGKHVEDWIVGSRVIKKNLIEECGVDKNHVHYVPYGVAPKIGRLDVNRAKVRASIGLAEDAYTILHPSVFEKRKGHYYTLHAFRDFKQTVPGAKLLLAGSDGSHRENVKRLVRKLNIEDDVIFTGFYSPIEELIVSADLLCLPSQAYDTTPLVILLALACGVPTLTTLREDWEGFLFDEYNALLVKTSDYNAITEKMLNIYKNEPLRNNIVENGFRTYDKYFKEAKMVNDTIKVLRNGLC